MDVTGFLLSNDADRDVLVTIPPSSLGPFDQPIVQELIGGLWIDISRVPNRTWTDRTLAVGAVLTYLRGFPPISAGVPSSTRE